MEELIGQFLVTLFPVLSNIVSHKCNYRKKDAINV